MTLRMTLRIEKNLFIVGMSASKKNDLGLVKEGGFWIQEEEYIVLHFLFMRLILYSCIIFRQLKFPKEPKLKSR